MKFGIAHELSVANPRCERLEYQLYHNAHAPWHLLPPLSMISATYSVGDTELPLARFVMPY
ncbi:MAG: hypothetical protein IH797_01255 [Chloroflexi bacterium]|nr:hypothetical protein [Chloroflexota bacterium]